MVNNHYRNRILRKANKWLIYLILIPLPLKSKQPAHYSPSFQLGNKVWNERTLTKKHSRSLQILLQLPYIWVPLLQPTPTLLFTKNSLLQRAGQYNIEYLSSFLIFYLPGTPLHCCENQNVSRCCQMSLEIKPSLVENRCCGQSTVTSLSSLGIKSTQASSLKVSLFMTQTQ